MEGRLEERERRSRGRKMERERVSEYITRKQTSQQMITYFALCSRDWTVNDEYCSGQFSDPDGEWNVSNTLTIYMHALLNYIYIADSIKLQVLYTLSKRRRERKRESWSYWLTSLCL